MRCTNCGEELRTGERVLEFCEITLCQDCTEGSVTTYYADDGSDLQHDCRREDR